MKRKMRMICLLLALCLVTVCSPGGAEDQSSRGKPFANPNMYDAFPERPGPEENFNIYANYDSYVRAAAGVDVWNDRMELRAEHVLAGEVLEIARNPEYTDTESEILPILYNLADPEKLERDGSAPLTARVERLKAEKTLDELTALIGEDGFLLSAPFLLCKEANSGCRHKSFQKDLHRRQHPDQSGLCHALLPGGEMGDSGQPVWETEGGSPGQD